MHRDTDQEHRLGLVNKRYENPTAKKFGVVWSFWQKLGVEYRYLTFAAVFTLVLTIYELLIFSPATYALPDSYAVTLIGEAFSIVMITTFFWASFTIQPLLRVPLFILFITGTLTEYGYRYGMGRFSLTEDYYTDLQTLDVDWFKNAALTFLGGRWPVVFPILAFGLLLVFTNRSQYGGLGRFASVLAALTLFFAALFPYSHGAFPILSFGAAYRTITFTGLRYAITYRGPRITMPDFPPASHPDNNIVFIVDESVRGDHLSVNGYARPTTPYLDELYRDGLLQTWGPSASASTTSLSSNALLVTGVNQIPDTGQQIFRQPIIFDYAHKRGYETYYLDVQMNQLWLVSSSDLKNIDHWLPADKFKDCPPSDVDFCAARYINEQIHTSTGKFIWVNKIGAHFPYKARLPESVAYWKPISPGYSFAESTKEEIINTYDTVLAYNLEGFFRQVVTPETLDHTIFVYTSDHGQTLSEHGETWPHSGATHNEALVPILLIQKAPSQVDTQYPASHFNLFATLLDLMHVPAEARVYPYSISLLKATTADSAPRFYISGDMISRFRSLVLPFDPEK